MIKSIIFFILILSFIFFDRIYLFLQMLVYLPKSVIDNIRYKDKKRFPYYGCRFYVGRQGSGKTMSMVHELEKIRRKFPKTKIYTNFGYLHGGNIDSLADLCDESLFGESGTVFAIDEIQNEFSCLESKNVPVEILGAITQQRKHQCYIICTSQVFMRIAKPLREQAFKVSECHTFNGRITYSITYDGIQYSSYVDRSEEAKKEHMPVEEYDIFYQNERIRKLYDSFEIIKRLGVKKHEENNIFDMCV